MSSQDDVNLTYARDFGKKQSIADPIDFWAMDG